MLGLNDMRKSMKNDFKKVEITWQDINASDGGWITKEEMDNHDVAVCKDICYIYRETDDKIFTFSSINSNGNDSYEFGFASAFPKGCIKSIREL